MVRRWFYLISAVVLTLVLAGAFISPLVLWALAVVGPLIALGLHDALQNRRTILKNFPLLGRARYLFEAVRPEIQQYFVESNIDAFPIEREFRSIVYQRAKGELETKPFGTFSEMYDFVTEGQFLQDDGVPAEWRQEWRASNPDHW